MLSILFDLDGTIANIDHRLHYLDKNDWHGFFMACIDDEPILPVINVLKAFVEAGHHVEIWSGRSSVAIYETFEWLDKHIGKFEYQKAYELLTKMRIDGDNTPDYILKESWLHEFHQNHGKFPDIIIDDRPKVLRMWRSYNITTFAVGNLVDF